MFSTVYLEAQEKSQALITLKWTLRAAGVEICSVWHDEGAPGREAMPEHLDGARLRCLLDCQTLIILHESQEELRPEMALLMGLALGSGLQVVWIGHRLPILNQFAAIRYFATVDACLGELSPAGKRWEVAA